MAYNMFHTFITYDINLHKPQIHLNVVLWPVAEDVIHVTLVIDGNEETPRFSKDETVTLTSLAYCWGVNDGRNFFNVVGCTLRKINKIVTIIGGLHELHTW